MSGQRSAYIAGLAACILFLALGAVFLTRAGAHYDETLFVRAIYHPDQVACALKLGAVRAPLMLTSYAGTLKAALYTPVFYLFGNTLLTLRIPALAIGGVSIWLFFLTLRRLTGNGIAVLLSILLATDASYLVAEKAAGPGHETKRWEKLSIWMNDELNHPRHSCQRYLLMSGFVLGPVLAWFGIRRRPALLLALGGFFSYVLMITTQGAGGSAHHIVLLWPLPQLLTGVLLADAARLSSGRAQRAMVVAVMACVVSNVAVLNGYLAGFITTGPSTVWSDAILPLVQEIRRSPERIVFAADWGISQQVDFYGAGGIGQYPFADAIVSSLQESRSRQYLKDALADPRTLFITHADGREAFQGVRKRLIGFAAEHGYRDHILNVVHDRHGRDIFEIHQFRL